MKNSEDKAAEEAARWIKELGPFESIERFFRKLGKANTRKAYSHALVLYFRWLREEKGIALSPDQLIKDNLNAVFGSQPTQVEVKRKHTDWMDEYLNRYAKEVKHYSDSQRGLIYASISMFYKRNDATLFGDFSLSRGEPTKPPKPLSADDIRRVLKALPVSSRTPLLCVWQSSIEINRVLSLKWADVTGPYPVKVEMHGRKIHRKPYASFLGRDSLEQLAFWRDMGDLPREGTHRTGLCVRQQAQGADGPELAQHSSEEDGGGAPQARAHRERESSELAQPFLAP